MAAAAIKSHIPSVFHRSHDNHDSSTSSSPPQAPQSSNQKSDSHVDSAAHEQQKKSISQWDDNRRPLSPDQIAQDPSQKEIGHSSKNLRFDDFELIKTLGTGTAASLAPAQFANRADSSCTGTFARVWLAQLPENKENGSNRVFALKVLRKVDGEPPFAAFAMGDQKS